MSVEFYGFQSAITDQNMNAGVFARFYDRAVKTGAFDKNGLPEFENKLYIEIRIRDERDVFDQPADERHIQRFRKEYERYLSQKEKIKKGTRLEMFAFLSPKQIECCHFRSIFTVEDLDELSKENAEFLGLGQEKELARLFLEKSAGNDFLAEFKKKEKAYTEEIKALKAELSKYRKNDDGVVSDFS